MAEIPFLVKDLALILMVAGIVTIIFKKLKQPLVLGYIVAGFLVSPHMPYTMSVIDETDINTDEVQILTKVRVLNLKTNQEKVYQLVTEGEANILEGKIATTTPIAKGLLGKKVGDTAEVVVPAGKMQFKILEISI